VFFSKLHLPAKLSALSLQPILALMLENSENDVVAPTTILISRLAIVGIWVRTSLHRIRHEKHANHLTEPRRMHSAMLMPPQKTRQLFQPFC